MLNQHKPIKYFREIGTLLLLLSFITGCGSSTPKTDTISPTLTMIPPTKTAIPPSNTPVPPTNTLSPPPTETPPPTLAATETLQSTPKVLSETVRFTTSDGVDLSGTIFGEGDIVVLLLHMGKGKASNNTQKDWHSFARTIADQGYPALTLDFRGRGKSGGEFGNDLLPMDVLATLQFLRDRGYERFVCAGAGMGGLTCMRLAIDGVDFEGLVVLSASLEAGPNNKITTTEIAQIQIPKLFYYGENDGYGFSDAMETIYASSTPPKNLVICPNTAAHGTELLNSACGDKITQQTLAFLDELR